MSNNKKDNISYNYIFLLFGPLTRNINLFDKFEDIQYNGIRIPRIPLDSNNSINLSQILYNQKDLSKLNDSKTEKKYYKDELYIPIKGDEDENDNTISSGKSKINILINDKNNNSTLNTEENLLENTYDNHIKNECIQNINNLNEDRNINLIPPSEFISIINETNDINKKNNYNNINDIIKDNINEINILTKNLNYIHTNSQIPINKNNLFKNNREISNFQYQLFPKINFEQYQNSFYSSFNINSKKIKNSNNKPLFKVDPFTISNEIQKEVPIQDFYIPKRGRKERKVNKRIHRADDNDNLLRKIQVHFLTFITNYINDVIKAFSNGKKIPLFKNLDYKIKKTVNHKYVEELKTKSIAEILQLRVSPKMKNHDDSVNKNIYNIVITSCPFMYGFLQRNYLSLFKEYYYNKNKIFIVNGKIIPISIKTKTFNDLINKYYSYKEKLKKIAICFFLNHYRRIKKPNFKIKVFNKNKVKIRENG